jgi:hypothetical protein
MPAAKKTVLKDIAFTLPKDTAPYKVVSVLQEQFKSPETVKEDGTTVAARKLQGRLLIGALLEAVTQYASPETLSKLAEDCKGKGEGDKKGKASEYIAAITSARAAAPAAAMSAEELSVEELEAIIAKKKAAQAPGGKTKDVAAL